MSCVEFLHRTFLKQFWRITWVEQVEEAAAEVVVLAVADVALAVAAVVLVVADAVSAVAVVAGALVAVAEEAALAVVSVALEEVIPQDLITDR